jgi:hypothetical protein
MEIARSAVILSLLLSDEQERRTLSEARNN